MKRILRFVLSWFPLITIVLFAAIIRMWKLGSLPMNLQEDEVMTGYVGRFILKNWRDVYGNPWPFWYFDKFGDYYIVLPIYLKGLSTFIFGVNEFAIRFPSALLGALSVIPVFFISYWTFNKKKIGYFAALFLTILPWHITLSRASAEGIMGIFFYSTGLMFIVGYMNRKKRAYALLSFIFFIICYWIYHPYRVVIPLTLLLLSAVSLFFKDKKTLSLALTGFLIFTLFTGYISTTKWGKGRFSQTSILSPMSGVSVRIQELIYGEGQQKIVLARIFHNKILGYGREFLRQYSIYFSGEYLFVKGGLSYAYSVPEQGLLYFSFIIPLIAAAIFLARGNFPKAQQKVLFFLILLFFLVPIPASLTYIDAPNIQRSVDMTVFFSLFAGYGLFQLSEQKKWLKVIYFVAIAGFILKGYIFGMGIRCTQIYLPVSIVMMDKRHLLNM
ncbi:hypothetical protein COY90_05410 [Candidatus Roizmanbacteria bacterium CG_4_10_14_0_8_um_filter_39_9]|uniref:Glycosyltransferase RgtA/B/C/D-like domain-containing protein n=1 Tax=Candidatus Roizmanbacteria bacterium CG_4_10_14_0_8_um_filter_39_9 TaxID=1974829 RepID=A0A2M7QC78_9BACT|nr:MAG: hypothetical protein COY90_05410 [Candidatus Roizmanbacteria bacterium CG_4_10_14_0_8_um_filter_39_9]